MNRLETTLGWLAAGLLASAFQAQAVTNSTNVDSASPNSGMGATAQGCLQLLVSSVSEGENCMYDGGFAGYEFPVGSGTFPADPFGEATGPFSQVQYYDSVANPLAFDPLNFTAAGGPVPGDGKIRQVINGSVTVDDNGNGFGADDLLSFTLTMTSPGTGDIIRNLSANVADKYTSMTQVLAATAVNSATPNASGGFDYVIGSEGFPTLLTFIDGSANETVAGANDGPCVGQVFGDMECDASFSANGQMDPLRWDPWAPTDRSVFAAQFPVPHVGPPESAGLGTLEGNIGARTTGTVVNLACADDGTLPTGASNTFCFAGKTSFFPLLNAGGVNDAPGGGVTAEDVDWDHVYLKVSTDGNGNMVTAEGFYVQEYMVFGPPFTCGSDRVPTPQLAQCNTWLAGRFTLTGEPAATAVDDAESTLQNTLVNIDVLANDTGFVDPVTVTIAAIPANGSAVPMGSPGNQAAVMIAYTPGPGFVGADSFDYTVDDGVNSDTATVTVTVEPPGAVADPVATRLNTAITIPVGANDSGFVDPVTVVTSVQPDMGGTVNAVNGSPGPIANVTIDYTPAAALGTPTYTETFTYQVTDSTVPTPIVDTAVVTVTVSNEVPAAVAATVAPAESSPAATDVSGLAGANLGDAPSVISITGAPADGAATVAGNVITYTPTGFFTGPDSYEYTITDDDGETSAATVSIMVGPALDPTASNDTATVDEDGSVTIDVVANDSVGSGVIANHIVAVSTGPSSGSATVGGGNVVTYTPNSGFSGSDSFQYTLQDENGDVSGPATVTITVVEGQLDITIPGGNGAIDLLSLGLLAAVPLLWRRRRL